MVASITAYRIASVDRGCVDSTLAARYRPRHVMNKYFYFRTPA
jgi:hypothetical protein